MKHSVFDLAPGDTIVCDHPSGPVWVTVLSVEEDEVLFDIDVPDSLTLVVDGRIREWQAKPSCKGLPRMWLLFAFILSHKVRHEVFYPCFNEFLEDYVFARKKYRTTWAKRWLAVAFSWRTVRMIGQCCRIQFGDWGARAVAFLLGAFGGRPSQ